MTFVRSSQFPDAAILEWPDAVPGGGGPTPPPAPVYFAPGPYRICYVQGAMRYDPHDIPPYGWTVNGNQNIVNPAQFGLPAGFYIVDSFGNRTLAPGLNQNFSTQADCEAANAGQSIVYSHVGGILGVQYLDFPYFDNVDGSPNPTFTIAGPGPVITFTAS